MSELDNLDIEIWNVIQRRLPDQNGKYDIKSGIAEIKAVFADAGYSKHNWSIRPGSVQIDGVLCMTGQEWYDRFVEASRFGESMDSWEGIAANARKAAGLEFNDV